ncbi:MAG: DUF615 domain-containing protein [Polyangiaceae bacterium]|nr:DUF615 domain-containing protein [Polyangiaceae bacterium]
MSGSERHEANQGDDEAASEPGASHGWAGPSRSQKKRDAREVGDLGAALVRLGPAALKRLPIDDELRDAVGACRGMQRGALARHLRFLGKLLRSRDHAAIAQAMADVGQASGAEILREKAVESWRERLLGGGDAELSALLAEYPEADRQAIRQLVRQGREEPTGARAQRARRELFRQLRALLAAAAVPRPAVET